MTTEHWYKSEELANIEGLTRTDVWELLELVELAQQQEVYESANLHQKLLDTVYNDLIVGRSDWSPVDKGS